MFFYFVCVSLTSSGNEEYWILWWHRLNSQVCRKLHSILHFNPVAWSYSPVVIPSMALLFCKSSKWQSWSARGTIYDNCIQVKCFANLPCFIIHFLFFLSVQVGIQTVLKVTCLICSSLNVLLSPHNQFLSLLNEAYRGDRCSIRSDKQHHGFCQGAT